MFQHVKRNKGLPEPEAGSSSQLPFASIPDRFRLLVELCPIPLQARWFFQQLIVGLGEAIGAPGVALPVMLHA